MMARYPTRPSRIDTAPVRPARAPITFPLYERFCRWCGLPFWTPAPNRRPCCDEPECRAKERALQRAEPRP